MSTYIIFIRISILFFKIEIRLFIFPFPFFFFLNIKINLMKFSFSVDQISSIPGTTLKSWHRETEIGTFDVEGFFIIIVNLQNQTRTNHSRCTYFGFRFEFLEIIFIASYILCTPNY